MGITIHWRGQLRDASGVTPVVESVRAFSRACGWRAYDLPVGIGEYYRVVDNEVQWYQSTGRGVAVRPHRDCEVVMLDFDNDGYVSSSCKTQFAGADVHIAVIDMLANIQMHFRSFEVYDEGGYWETRDAHALAQRIGALDRAISTLADTLCDPDDEDRGTLH